MPTIHVHIADDTVALTVIATMLNAGFPVSVDLDIVEPRPTKVERIKRNDRATRGNEAKRREAEREARRQAKNAELDAMSPAERDQWFLHRQQVRIERFVESYIALGVECKACGSSVGDPCVGKSGKPYGNFSHIDRIHGANIAGLLSFENRNGLQKLATKFDQDGIALSFGTFRAVDRP